MAIEVIICGGVQTIAVRKGVEWRCARCGKHLHALVSTGARSAA